MPLPLPRSARGTLAGARGGSAGPQAPPVPTGIARVDTVLADTVLADTVRTDTVRADALKAIALAPSLAEGHLALAVSVDTFRQDLTEASREYERAVALAPGNTQVLRRYALSAAELGRADAAITAARRAAILDPLSALTRRSASAWLCKELGYSYLNATIGSVRIALRAGM